jgi:hypothetical protein
MLVGAASGYRSVPSHGQYHLVSLAVILLAAASGVLELAGLGLVAYEIRSDRDLAVRYLTRIQEAPPVGIQGPMVRPEVRMMDDMLLRQGTAEQQVAKLRDAHSGELRRITEATSRAAYEERARFANFVQELLQGGLGQRKIGAVLVAVGIVLGAAANIVGA